MLTCLRLPVALPVQVRILGEAYTPDDEEDSAAGQVRLPAWQPLPAVPCCGCGCHCRPLLLMPASLACLQHRSKPLT